MFKISREVDLGLLWLTELVGVKKPVGLKEWSEQRGLPYRFLSKVALRSVKNLSIKPGKQEVFWMLSKRLKSVS